QISKNGLLVRHGDRQPVDGYVSDTGEQVFQRLRVQRQKNSVHIFAAQRGVHNGRRKRMRDWVASYAVDSGGRIHLIYPIGTLQLLGCDLSWRCLLVRSESAEGECA